MFVKRIKEIDLSENYGLEWPTPNIWKKWRRKRENLKKNIRFKQLIQILILFG